MNKRLEHSAEVLIGHSKGIVHDECSNGTRECDDSFVDLFLGRDEVHSPNFEGPQVDWIGRECISEGTLTVTNDSANIVQTTRILPEECELNSIIDINHSKPSKHCWFSPIMADL